MKVDTGLHDLFLLHFKFCRWRSASCFCPICNNFRPEWLRVNSHIQYLILSGHILDKRITGNTL